MKSLTRSQLLGSDVRGFPRDYPTKSWLDKGFQYTYSWYSALKALINPEPVTARGTRCFGFYQAFLLLEPRPYDSIRRGVSLDRVFETSCAGMLYQMTD